MFEELFVTYRQYIYDLMCDLYAYDKENYKSTDPTDFGGGIPLPKYSTTDSIVYLCVNINFIGNWLNVLVKTFAWIRCDHQYNTK